MRLTNLTQTDGVFCKCGGEISYVAAHLANDGKVIRPAHFRCSACKTVWTVREMEEDIGGSF